MIIMINLNSKILKTMKKNGIFQKFLEFKIENSLIKYFNTLFFEKFFI